MTESDSTPSSRRPFAERVVARQVGPCDLYMLKTPVDSVVSWRGSFCSYPNFAEGDDLLQDLAVSLLDKGTNRRDRFAIAEVLEDRGAELHFTGRGFRVLARGRALSEDVPAVMEVMAEQLREPLFDPEEFMKARTQAAASLQRSMEDTSSQASAALSRCLYGSDHPNYTPDPAGQLKALQNLTVEQVQSFHQKHFGSNRFILAVVGDLDAAAVEETVEQYFGDWKPHQAPDTFGRGGRERAPEQSVVPMPDKDSIDVRFGHHLQLRRQDDDYMPLYIGNYILGGNFSARLMATVRDEMGLTYGIGSRLNGINTEYDGHWQIGVTLSRDKLQEGIAATLDEVRRFVREGATAEELDEKKTTITGSFKVGLATTGGLAEALLRNVQRGFGPAYLDRLPDEVRAVGLEQLNSAVRAYLNPDRLHRAMAGALDASTVAVPS